MADDKHVLVDGFIPISPAFLPRPDVVTPVTQEDLDSPDTDTDDENLIFEFSDGEDHYPNTRSRLASRRHVPTVSSEWASASDRHSGTVISRVNPHKGNYLDKLRQLRLLR